MDALPFPFEDRSGPRPVLFMPAPTREPAGLTEGSVAGRGPADLAPYH